MKPTHSLRTPETIGLKDTRTDGKRTLKEYHCALDGIRLARSIPKNVARLIEISKNLALYAYFVHEFHAVATLVGCIALEVALKKKWRMSHGEPQDGEYPHLKPLLTHALNQGWIRIESFTWVRSNAAYNARVKALNARYEQFPTGGFDPPVVDEGAIQEQIASLSSWATEWANGVGESRNARAHGDLFGVDQSEGPLRLLVDAINGMFEGRNRAQSRPVDQNKAAKQLRNKRAR